MALDQFETGVYENFVGSMYTYTSAYPQSEALKNNPDTLTYYLPIVETHARYYADADFANSAAYPVSVGLPGHHRAGEQQVHVLPGRRPPGRDD